MEQEIRRPDYVPRTHDRSSSNVNCFLAAFGVTVMTLCLVGSAAAATVWAGGRLLDLSDTIIYVLLAIVAVPVVILTIWTAGRAWHLEQRLARGQDVDVPVFKLFHYFGRVS